MRRSRHYRTRGRSMTDDQKPKKAAKPEPAVAAKLPALDERRLSYADLAPFAAQLDPDALVAMTGDGRPTVRANAVLGLAVLGHAAPQLCTLLRDSDLHVALAAAQAIAKLGKEVRPPGPQAGAPPRGGERA